MSKAVWLSVSVVVFLLVTVNGLALGQEVTLLLNSHFVKAHEAELTKQAEEWATRQGVKVKLDFIADVDLEAKITSEAEAGSGHDIVALRDYVAYIYRDILHDVTSLVEDLQVENGPATNVAKVSDYIDGRWMAVPWYHQSFPLVYRKDYVEAAGYSVETMNNLNTDTFLALAQKLHELGHPVGIPISMCPDSNASLAPILWAFGSSLFGKSNIITVVSDETANALRYVTGLSKYMPPEVTGWDNAANNLFILSGVGGVTANPPSIYATALSKNLEFAQEIYHAPFPAGPKGRFRCTGLWSFGIPKYAKNKDLAMDLIRHLMKQASFQALVKASEGYNQPVYEGYQDISIWKEIPSLNAYEPVVETLFPIGWPGLEATPTKASVRAQLLYIMPIMFAKVVTGEETVEGAMQWAETELKRLVTEEKVE